jgi:hypothetical protein
VTVGGTAQTKNERAEPLVKVSYVEQNELMFTYVDHTLKQVVDGWTIEHDKAIIRFSEAKFQRANTGDPDIGVVELPAIEVVIAYESKDGTDPLDDFYAYQHGPISWPGSAVANAGDYISKMPELVLYQAEDETPYNETELDAYSATLVDLIQRELWDGITGASKTYLGIKDIYPDGAITSVTWSINKPGAKTKVVRGQDRPPVNLPTYKDFQRKLENARDVAENKAKSDDMRRQVREGRASTIQNRAEGQNAKFKGRRLGEVAIKNTDATDGPAGGLAEIVDVEESTGAIEVKRPTGDNLSNVVVLKYDVPAGGYGVGREGKATGYIKHSGTDPAAGELLGSVTDQWEAEVSTGGTHEVVGIDSSSNAYAKPTGGAGGGMVAVEITSKVDDTTYLGDEYRNGTDVAATNTGVTIRVLQIAAGETIPNNTIFPAWRQKWSGTEQWTIDPARDY